MLSNLRLQNFRSYKDKSFIFKEGVNILVGPNTVGKTNLLEAILFSRKGNSYRAKDNELIMFNEAWCRLDSVDDGLNRSIRIKTEPLKTKDYILNDKPYKRLPSHLKLPVVLFEPDQLRLLSGSPEGRRNYLDSFNEQVIDGYSTLLRKYNRVLAQRNNLLKYPNKPTKASLFPWNIRLSQLGGQLTGYRQQLANKINELLPDIYRSLSSDTVLVRIEYKSQFKIEGYENIFLQTLETNIDHDLATGFTSFGPHRDDFVASFNDHESSSYASRGELRTAVLGLKITELEALKSVSANKPVVLLDDVFSELDKSRRDALTKYLKDVQSFITTTDADNLINSKTANVIQL